MTKSTCETCKHWEGNRGLNSKNNGPCLEMSSELEIYDENDTYLYGCEVWTPDDFGCNKWEVK